MGFKFSDYNPQTLDEAVNILFDNLSEDDSDYIKENGTGIMHMFFGMSMRNQWGLWQDSSLAKHFKETYGLGHADDMSGLILSKLETKVKGTEFNIDSEVARYKDHWANYNVDPLTGKEH